MKLFELQDRIAQQLDADSSLRAFGAARKFSLADDEEEVKEAISTRLRESGVCLEVGSIEGTENASTAGRFALLNAQFDVYAAENPRLAHAPAGMLLVQTVIEAVTKRISQYEHAPRLVGYEAARSEQGYILHVLSFTVPVQVP